jgi:mannose-1-phosphate guanylyltransferase
MNLMLLCAGEGRRLRPFTAEVPKPAVPFLGAPMVSYSLNIAEELPLKKIVFNTHHLADQIKNLFADMNFKRIPWKDFHEPVLLGSGGGIHNAKQALVGTGTFLVMNGDEVILPFQFGLIKDMLAFHKYHKGIATLLTMNHPEVGTKFGGAWVDERQKVRMFSKTDPRLDGIRGEHFLGVMFLNDEIFEYFKNPVQDENILYDTLTAAMAANEEVYTFRCETNWFETGNPEDFLKATETCASAIESRAPDYWIDYLKQVLRLSLRKSPLIEKNTALGARILEIQKKFL